MFIIVGLLFLRFVSCGTHTGKLTFKPRDMRTISHPGFIEILLRPHQEYWIIETQIAGSQHKSAFDLERNQTRIVIDTDEHPGLYVIKLIENGSVLTTRYINSVCQRKIQMDLHQSYTIRSPEFPLSYHAGMRCSWNISKHTGQNSWFKITMQGEGQGCLTSFQMDFKDELCSTVIGNKSVVITDDAILVKFSSRKPGPASSFHVEAIPQLSSPTILTTTVINDTITINWTWNDTYFEDLMCVIEFSVYPSALSNTVERNCSDLSYSLDSSSHRGQRYLIRMFAKTSFWESQKLDYVYQTSECRNELFITRGDERDLYSDGYPYHLQPYSKCSWVIRTDEDNYLKIQIHDVGFCSKPAADCSETCLYIGQENRLCAVSSNVQKGYLLQQNNTVIMLNSSRAIGGRGFNMSIKSVDSPPPYTEQFHVESEQGFINVSWRPYTGPKTLVRYIITYRIVPEVAYHVVPIHVNMTGYAISTDSHEGQMFAVRLSYLTAGGEGIPSNLKIIRAACGYTAALPHNQSMVIASPTVNANYLSNVFCKWNILSNQSFWFKFDFKRIDIESSKMCLKDYVEFPKNRKYCGNRTGSVIIRKSEATIAFVTDDSNSGLGFTGTITALYPPSSQPTRPTLLRTQYGLLVTWEKPLANPAYVRGYRVKYKLHDELEVLEIIVSANERSAFINTRLYPGILFDVWISAIGETEDSSATEHMQSFSECGKNLIIDNHMQFITTPSYPEFPMVKCQCVWTVSSAQNYTLAIMKINKLNTSAIPSDNDYLMINAKKHLLANIWRGMQFSFDANGNITIEIRSSRSSILASLQSTQTHTGHMTTKRVGDIISSSYLTQSGPS